jgi:hypothetical protein
VHKHMQACNANVNVFEHGTVHSPSSQPNPCRAAVAGMWKQAQHHTLGLLTP